MSSTLETGSNLFSDRRTLCLVTGASRGFGQACVKSLAEAMLSGAAGSTMLLISRHAGGLAESRETALAINPGLTVLIWQVNLAEAGDQQLRQELSSLLEDQLGSRTPFDLTVTVHNAGSLGDISKTALQHTNTAHLANFTFLNIVSPIALTGIIHELLSPSLHVLVNISSLAAIQAFPTWSIYCASKAARDLFFQCLARESPDIRVLNYAPGPLDTAMQAEVRASCGDEKLRQLFQEMKTANKLVVPLDSARRLVVLLTENKWTSGDHVDYMDIQ